MIGFRSIVEVLGKALRDVGLTYQTSDDDMQEWTLFAMRSIGEYSQYEQKTAVLEVYDHRCLLPEDFCRVDETLFSQNYKWQLNTLVVKQKEGKLTLPYLAFRMEEDEFTGELTLLVPDDTAYEEAIVWYIYSRLILQDKFPNKTISFEWANNYWNARKIEARASLRMPSAKQQERAGANRVNPRQGGFSTNGYEWERK